MNRLALTFVALMVGGAALAQPPQGGEQGGFGGQGAGRGGRGGGFGGGQGGFPGGGGFGGGMMGMSREISAVNIPLRVMALYLSLTDGQAGKIALIREDMQDAARPQMPPRRASQDPNVDPSVAPSAQGGRPDMQAMMQEMQTNVAKAERKATADTNALLSEPQRVRLSLLIKALKGLQDAGVRPEAAVKLLLNEDQLTKLAQGRKPESVLSTEQQTIAQGYMSPMGRGGRGGRGGGGQGGDGFGS
ncbi:Spy/CpxP family protein refolding chaperone [Armatimonas sp.]|uniref:Spy/CpxP family protein refolding chaperone n=1 Tax=Armatimonas sp. TaxID=1872638 RepID=UPI003750531F